MSLSAALSPRQKRSQGSLGWRVLVEHGLSAQEHMARDAALAGETLPTVRFFCWQPAAISFGLKQKPPAWFDQQRFRQAQLEFVERPTGGGIAFHGSDVSLSIIVPRRLQVSLDALMDAVCQNALSLCGSLGVDAHSVIGTSASSRIDYCLTEPSPYAVMIGGKKVAGFALRRFPQTWLIQGSFLVRPVSGPLSQAIPAEVAGQLKAKAVAFSEAASGSWDEKKLADFWAQGWAHWWEETLLEALARE